MTIMRLREIINLTNQIKPKTLTENEMKIDIEKLAKIGIEGAFGKNQIIRFENLQRFVERELSRKGSFSEYDANITYSITNDEWFDGYAFDEKEKQKIIQAILNYNPSDNEIKKTPSIKTTLAEQKEYLRCKKFDCETAEDRYYQGVSDLC